MAELILANATLDFVKVTLILAQASLTLSEAEATLVLVNLT